MFWYNPMILMDVTGILEDAGLHTYEAADGDAAVLMVLDYAHSIILLFSDVEMPGDTDSFALARHVAERYPGIGVVIASGRVTPQAGDMPEKATFIGKPFTTGMVHRHLRDTLPDGKTPEPLKHAI